MAMHFSLEWLYPGTISSQISEKVITFEYLSICARITYVVETRRIAAIGRNYRKFRSHKLFLQYHQGNLTCR